MTALGVGDNLMHWQLAPGTGYCEVGGDLVFLDLSRDRYFALRGEDRAAFDRLRYGGANDSDAMTRLVATGLIVRCAGEPNLAPTRLAIPEVDLSAMIDVRSSIAMGMRSAFALRWARKAMRPERIAATVTRLASAKRHIGVPGAEAAVRAVAASYAASRWLAGTAPRCLVDALALDRILLARCLPVSLVFGVHLNPFRAHCWLQTPEAIISGTAAEARNFTPILVVA